MHRVMHVLYRQNRENNFEDSAVISSKRPVCVLLLNLCVVCISDVTTLLGKGPYSDPFCSEQDPDLATKPYSVSEYTPSAPLLVDI
jgi:hypothetical protein